MLISLGKCCGKSESGKSESGKSDSGKSESGKSESGKRESTKRETNTTTLQQQPITLKTIHSFCKL